MKAHPSQLVVIQGRWTDKIASLLRKLGRFETLTTVSSSEFVPEMRNMNPETKYTAHSIKHGVMDYLISMRNKGVFTAENDEVVARLLKHRAHCALPDVTLGYANNRVELARVLGTAEITRHL